MLSNSSMLISLNDFCRELMLLKGPKYTLYFLSEIFLTLEFLIELSLLIDRITKETKIKDAKIKKIAEKKYRVYAGPFNNISSLQKSYNDISILEFENIEIIKND